MDKIYFTIKINETFIFLPKDSAGKFHRGFGSLEGIVSYLKDLFKRECNYSNIGGGLIFTLESENLFENDYTKQMIEHLENEQEVNAIEIEQNKWSIFLKNFNEE